MSSKQEILNIPKYGCYNIHASILPRWRGAAPIQRSIIHGDQVSGVSFIKIDEGLDTGDIVLTDEIEIKNSKKIAMRKLLNDMIRDASHSSLLEERKGKLSNLEADYQLKEYLVTDQLSIEQKQLLFNLRTRMVFVK